MISGGEPAAALTVAGDFDWNGGILVDVVFQHRKDPTRYWKGHARVDTGLGQTWLSEHVIDELGLERLRNKALMPDPTGGTSIVERSNIHVARMLIALSNQEQGDWILEAWPVLRLPETADADAIIGRDILQQGDLRISADGHYTFAVRRSLHYEVDLSGGVEEL